jgi:hypothetical protein
MRRKKAVCIGARSDDDARKRHVILPHLHEPVKRCVVVRALLKQQREVEGCRGDVIGAEEQVREHDLIKSG